MQVQELQSLKRRCKLVKVTITSRKTGRTAKIDNFASPSSVFIKIESDRVVMMSKSITNAYFAQAVNVVAHVETKRVDSADKFMLIQAARRLLSGLEMTDAQTAIWQKYCDS